MNTNKSILIIDTPKNCMNCQFRAHNALKYWCEQDKAQRYITENILQLNKPEWCPLIDIPAHIKDVVHINLGKTMDWEYIADHPEDNPFIGKDK